MEDDYSDVDLKWMLQRFQINYTDSELVSLISSSPSSSPSSSSTSSYLSNSLHPTTFSYSFANSYPPSSVFDILLFVTQENDIITNKSLTECIEYYSTQLRNWGKLKILSRQRIRTVRFRRKTY